MRAFKAYDKEFSVVGKTDKGPLFPKKHCSRIICNVIPMQDLQDSDR